MRKSLIAIALLSVSSTAFADNYVNGYYRSNGTYVQPHYRSNSNGTRIDNFSTQGNVNPYTGSAGTVEPYRVPAPNNNLFNSTNPYRRY